MDEVNTSAAANTSTMPPDEVTLEPIVPQQAEAILVETLPPAATLPDATLPTIQTADPEPVQRSPLDNPPAEPIQGVPLDEVVVTPVATEPELPTIQVEPVPAVPAMPTQVVAEPRVVERVVEKIVEKEVIKEVIKEIPVEKIVEKEVIKEVPVEKVVEKIVYRDAPPAVCPPPSREEREAIYRDFLIELSHEGTARKHALMQGKLDTIMTLFDTKERIMREDVMDVLECSGTTATRLLTELRHEGKIVLHGERGNGASYTRNT